MTAKGFLMQTIKYKRKVLALAKKEEELRAKAEGLRAIAYDRDRVQVSPSDQMPGNVAELVAVQEEYAQAIAECWRHIHQCEDLIGELHSEKQIEILRWRYIEDNNGRQYYFSEIAEKMGTDNTSSVIRLHKRAIKSLENKFRNGTTM